MTLEFILLFTAAYLLGAVPLSYLAARWARGIDLRKCGTGQVGAGNLWRMTRSWKLGLAVGVFDVVKGLVMVWVACLAGLTPGAQIAVGAAAVIGHNWSVFLRFSGGRAVGTAGGVMLIFPLINGLSAYPLLAFVTITVAGSLVLRSSPLPVLAGFAAAPLVSLVFGDPPAATLGYLAVLAVIAARRLSGTKAGAGVTPKILLNRLLFDRDIRDRKYWMYRKPERPAE
ncbi:MAG: glycerol-3-phosphate acyltransferase [Chloroflexi bacterium]|nr:glycerol-3-phosphate acyltransferase [Chloroflexota bacterium]